MTVLLQVQDLSVSYGAVHALRGVSVEIRAGQATGVLGSNGAGKTTLVRTIMGLVPAVSGTVTGQDGRTLLGRRPHQISRSGIAMVPEGGGVFPYLSVEENLLVGPAAGGLSKQRAAAALDDVYQRFPQLADRRSQLAGTLSGGERQMLAISRALATQPQILLLDEPSLGLAPLIVERVFEAIDALVAAGLGLLIIEQNARKALQSCATAVVLERGVVRLEGPASELAADEAVVAAYLGTTEDRGDRGGGVDDPVRPATR